MGKDGYSEPDAKPHLKSPSDTDSICRKQMKNLTLCMAVCVQFITLLYKEICVYVGLCMAVCMYMCMFVSMQAYISLYLAITKYSESEGMQENRDSIH
jgi:ferredoxin